MGTMNFFGLCNFIAASVLMPLSAPLVSVFMGWRLGKRISPGELSGLSPLKWRLLLFALRYLCPVGIALVLVVGLAG
jgi:NSS family neurotransmitter:Na+ symporter